MIDWHNPTSLANAIKDAGLTQKQFAIDAGVPPSSLNRFFKGRNLPNCGNLRKIEAAYAQLSKSAGKRARRRVAQKDSAKRIISSDKAVNA